MDLKIILLFCILPCIGVVFVTWLLRFPWPWFLKAMIGLEIVIAAFSMLIEIDAQRTPGNSGWIMMFAAAFQIYLVLMLFLARLIIWQNKKRD